jgi:hypothetical protein
MDKERHIVIQVRKGDSILCSHRLTDDNFVDVIELVPIFISKIVIFYEKLKFGATRNNHVESLSSEEAFWIEQIKEVVVHEISKQLVGQLIVSPFEATSNSTYGMLSH